MPKDEEDNDEFVEFDENIEESDELDQENIDQFVSENNFKRLTLEEMIPSLQFDEDNQQERTRWIRLAQGDEEKEDETPIYDLDKSIKGKGYTSIEDYQSPEGDYSSFSRSSSPTMQSFSKQDQTGLTQSNQSQAYETSKERELKERRKKDIW
jgi:hypothetical protein